MAEIVLFAAFDVSKQVFFRSALSFGIVNLKPLLPGHVLVIPRRVVPRLADLTQPEVSDLFLSVQTVGKTLEQAYTAEALTISLQDGAAAGQSVPHVHVHIMPRRGADFGGNNDSVYPALETHEQHLESVMGGKDKPEAPAAVEECRVPSDGQRKARSDEVMEQEARWLASHF